MLDQAYTLRQLVQTVPAAARNDRISPPMIVVAGGRAGVGATTVATNLGAVLADRGERVVLVDGAQQGGDLADVAGASPAIERSLDDVIAGDFSAAEALAPGPAGTLVLGRRRPGQQVLDASRPAQQRIFAELQSLESEAGLLVVDAGSGASPWMRRFWLRAGLVIVVTTTDDLALLDSYALIKQNVGDGVGGDIRVLANQCDSDAVAGEAYRKLSNACQQFLSHSVRALPALPRHVPAGGARENGTPRVWKRPNSPFGHAMMWLGRAVGDAMRDEG
ncbi:MAG TPA: AAA family ATPase [Lacipirellulaceae bacterium]|jgi:flagellar biosynthesis protein FlhG|nr:AAA family ATPase [Lacipirellulaceae bacterium]